MYLKNYIKNSVIENSAYYSVCCMRYLMGTFFKVEVFDEEIKAKEVIELVFNEARHIQQLLSRFQEDSPVYKINNFVPLRPHKIEVELLNLIRDCLEFSKLTNGAFDIAVASLIELWRQAEENDLLPTHDEVISVLSGVGYRNISLNLDEETILLRNKFTKLDFGAVGKGYCLDRAISILKENNINRALLDFGGNIYYLNDNISEFEEEYFGIRNPLNTDDVIVSLPVRNKVISTSANYERNFKIKGKIYGHIINPLTGYPQGNDDLLSVSVISPKAMAADILSTAIFILGLDSGMELIEKISDAEAVIITRNQRRPQVHYSSKLADILI
jgi:thiamine biosynthesis lipoprotein